MPNGGVPFHMVLTPAEQGTTVIYCKGPELTIVSKDDWETQKSEAKPLATFTKNEGLVLERFLRYWLQDEEEGPLYHEKDVAAEFDF